jgi:hypothetical protein
MKGLCSQHFFGRFALTLQLPLSTLVHSLTGDRGDVVGKLLSYVLAPEAKSTERGLQLIHDLLILPPK